MKVVLITGVAAIGLALTMQAFALTIEGQQVVFQNVTFTPGLASALRAISELTTIPTSSL